MKRLVLMLALVSTGACASEPTEAFTCGIGELTGTWHVHYEQADGNCGDIADETVILGADGQAAGACTVYASEISPDKCRLDRDFTCPTVDGAGAQHWVGTLRQTGSDRLEGPFTVQLDHRTVGTCRSTYNVLWTKE